MQALSKLRTQLTNASNSESIRSYLNDFIFDDDVLDFIDVNHCIVSDNFRDDVREIQHGIVNFFGE